MNCISFPDQFLENVINFYKQYVEVIFTKKKEPDIEQGFFGDYFIVM